MYDLTRIETIISDIIMYLKKLESFKIKSEKDLEDDKNFYSSSMIIFNSINRAMDLAEQIIRDNAFGTTVEYKELFKLLELKKIISPSLSESLQKLVIVRNKISHRYGKITKKDVLNAIQDLSSLNGFIKEIEKEVKK